MAIQSVTTPGIEAEPVLSDDEIAFQEAIARGGLSENDRTYFAAHGFNVPD